MKYAKHVLTLTVMMLGLSLLSGCLDGALLAQYLTPAEQWMCNSMGEYQKELWEKEREGTITEEEKKHMAAMHKVAEGFMAVILKRFNDDCNRQPKDPNSQANRPNLASGTGVTSGGISFGCVKYFYSGGSWWPIAMAMPADIAKIKAGKMEIKTSGGQIGFVGSRTSSGPPRPMLK